MSKIFSKKYLVTYDVTNLKRKHTESYTVVVNGGLLNWFDQVSKDTANKYVITFAIAI